MVNLKDFTGHNVNVHFSHFPCFVWDEQFKEISRIGNGVAKIVSSYPVTNTDELFEFLEKNEKKDIVFLTNPDGSIYFNNEIFICIKACVI